MSTNDPSPHNGLISTLYVSTIDVSLARDSKKKIELIQLRKNSQPLRDIHTTLSAGGEHRERFIPPFALNPNDRICISVNCNTRLRKQVDIEISLRDIECMRDEQDGRSYRKKTRKVIVVVNGHQSSLLATTSMIIESCSRFRLLIIGNSGVGKSSLIRRVFGVANVHASETKRGDADIDREFISSTNERFVVHDSLGFEAGDEKNMEIVKRFVAERGDMPKLEDQLHAIWLCLETPYSGGRLLEAGVERFLQRRDEILGKIPLVVVLTKIDLLDAQSELDLPPNENPVDYKSKYMNKHCVKPLHKAAGESVTHVAISVQDGYAESLSGLVEATLKNMDKYHTNEAPRVVASIAQRVSIKEKIELSIGVGKKRYWKMLLQSAVFRGHTLDECLQVIRNDVITVWNLIDPDKCLTDDKIINALLRANNSEGSANNNATSSNFTSLGGLLASAVELLKGLSGSGEVTMAVLAPVAGITLSLLRTVYDTYQEAKKDVKILMAFIVDLLCVMQIIFLLTSSGQERVTLEITGRALLVYEEKAKKFVHMCVDAFDGSRGVFGRRDYVLDEIEALIWRYSITDREFDMLRREIGATLPSSSSSS